MVDYEDGPISPIYDPLLPWWLSALAALGLVLSVLLLAWAVRLLVVG